MLERNKTLIPTDTRETETRTILFYEHADNGDVFIVADPGLKLDEVESVQREVSELLAEEERRLRESAPSAEEGGLEVKEELPESDKDQSEEHGEKSPEAEEEAVALSEDELPHPLGTDA
jgi:hypothetical protein